MCELPDKKNIEGIMSDSNECLDQNSILRLNDDCFYTIFSFLPTLDWCSLRETCTRLRNIADYRFESQNQNFQLKSELVSGSFGNLFLVQDIKRLIRNFGQFITKLTINRNSFHDREHPATLVRFLDRYCVALQDLKLVGIDLLANDILECGRLFSNLVRLVVDQWTREDTFVLCINQCVSLKDLEIIRMDFTDIERHITHHRCTSLESFTMKSCSGYNSDFTKHLFFNNNHLKRARFFGTFLERNANNAVTNKLPNLESLTISCGGASFSLIPLANVPALKKYEIDLLFFKDHEVHESLAKLAVHTNLEDLLLASFMFNDELVRRLCALRTLKILKFVAGGKIDGNICKQLARGLPSLMEIHCIECTNVTFNEIKEFVLHSSNLKKIVHNRSRGSDASITKDIFWNLVKARQEERNAQQSLLIFLNDDDLAEIRDEFQWTGCSETLNEQSHIVKLLPLDEEHIQTVYEFGSRFKTFSRYKYEHAEEDVDEDSDLEFFHDFGDSSGDSSY